MNQAILFVNASDKHNITKMLSAKKLGVALYLVAPTMPEWANAIVDNFIEADTRNIPETLKILHRAHEKTPFHGVITLLDKSVELVAAIAQEFNLPGSSLEAATTVKHKYKMREALERYDVPHPKFQYVKTLRDLQLAAITIGFPLIFKPVAASTSVAVFKVESSEDIEKTFQLMSTCERTPYWLYPDEYIAEEFMAGQEVSVEGLVNHDEIHFIGITHKSVARPGFTEWKHCFPAGLSLEMSAAIYNLATQAIRAVKINDCAFHIEIMITPTGPKIVEINSRMAGGFLSSHLVPLATGIDFAKASIETALGRSIELKPSLQLYACERNLFAKNNGTIRAWKNIDDILNQPGVHDFKLLRQQGEYVAVPPDGYENQLCAVITVAETIDEAEELAESALGTIECLMI